MTSWSPTKIMSNLATSLACSLKRMPRERSNAKLLKNALLSEDPDEKESYNCSLPNSRSESPEIPMLDSPSVFKMASNNDENSDPNAVAYKTRSQRSLNNSKNVNNQKSVILNGSHNICGANIPNRKKKFDSMNSDEQRPPLKMRIKLSGLKPEDIISQLESDISDINISDNSEQTAKSPSRCVRKRPSFPINAKKSSVPVITARRPSERIQKEKQDNSKSKLQNSVTMNDDSSYRGNTTPRTRRKCKVNEDIDTPASTPKSKSCIDASPIRKKTSTTKKLKRKSTDRVITVIHSETKSNKSDISHGRPSRRAVSIKIKSKSYKESPEKNDISSDGEGSDNYKAQQESSSLESSDEYDSSESNNIEGEENTKIVKKCKSNGGQKHTERKSRLKNRFNSASSTPGKKKVMTPRIPCRTIPLPNVVSPLQEAQMRLHVAAVPQNLPCREEEFYEILSFTEGKILDGTGGCMYISGLPGTGKTATVKEVIRTLNEQVEDPDDDIPEFDFIEINGMRLTEPNQAYPQIWKALTGEKVAVEQARNLLEKRFSLDETETNGNSYSNKKNSSKRKTVVLLVDELDMLWNRKQSVLYNIFEWPVNKSAKLVVLAIANTMDLPERVMINRVSSRMGLTRLTFSPYTHQQLTKIVESRLTGLKVFNKDAVQLVARKVSSLSGDARRALDICRRATEIAQRDAIALKKTKSQNVQTPKSRKNPKNSMKTTIEEDEEFTVGMNHVSQAHKEMFCSPKILAIRSCSQFEKMYLQSIVTLFQKTGIEETLFDRTLTLTSELALMEGFSPLTLHEIHGVLNRLSSMRLVLAEPGKSGRLDMKIRLNVSQDDVLFALKNGTDDN